MIDFFLEESALFYYNISRFSDFALLQNALFKYLARE